MFGFMKKQYDENREAIIKKQQLSVEQNKVRQSLTAEELHRLEEARHNLAQKYVFNERQQKMTANGDGNVLSSQESRKASRKTHAPPRVMPKPPKKEMSREDLGMESLRSGQNMNDIYSDEMMCVNQGLGKDQAVVKTSQIPSVKDAILAFEQPSSRDGGAQQMRHVSSFRLGSLTRSFSSQSSIENKTKILIRSPTTVAEIIIPAPKSYTSINLQLPVMVPASDCVKYRDIILKRQSNGEFGFTLRKGTIVNRCVASDRASWKSVIFAEPGGSNVNCGLMPGDRLIKVDNVNVENRSRDEVLELVKQAGKILKLKVEPSNELVELNKRSEHHYESSSSSKKQKLDNDVMKLSDDADFKQVESDAVAIPTDAEWSASEKVWLVHKGGFAAAQLLKLATSSGTTDVLPEGKCHIRLEHGGEILDVDEEDIEKANPPSLDDVEDLTLLRHLNESSVLHVLRRRYANDLIHTKAGPSTLIVLNPMHPLASYTDRVIKMFKECKTEDMPPHIYSMARSVLHDLISTRRDQSFVLMGRSGSGKTTNMRHILLFYAVTAGSTYGVVTAAKLNAVFTVLYAFGNSRTIMNTDTSNFTQIANARFDSGGQLTSLSIQAVMPIGSRLINRPEGEPTFHVFYNMLAGIEPELRKELHLEDLTQPCLFMTPLQRAEDCQLAVKSWSVIDQALTTLGVDVQEKKALYSIVAAIYHLGVAGASKGPNGNFVFARPAHGQFAAEILGTSVDELLRVIFSRVQQQQQPGLQLQKPSEKGDSPLDSLTGANDLEKFAADLYAETFQALVALINRALSSNIRSTHSVFIFDIPGFRNPATCNLNIGATLEDLCHNYINERLQLLYHDVLVAERQLYSQENVECDFDLIANETSSVVHLMDGHLDPTKKGGLLWLMEDGASSESSDESFLEAFFSQESSYLKNGCLAKSHSPTSFILNHFQRTTPVQYDIKGWLKTCRVSCLSREPVSQILQQSKKSSIRDLFGHGVSDGAPGTIDSSLGLRRAGSLRRMFASGATKFKRRGLPVQIKLQADMVIDFISKTRMHFVHCILPQPDAGLCELKMVQQNKVGLLEDMTLSVPLVRSQLHSVEIMPTIRLYRQGFPDRLPLQEFLRRYEILIPQSERPADILLDTKKSVGTVMEKLEYDKASYRIGVTQIFFRSGVLTQLNKMRDNCVSGWIVVLQALCRGHVSRQKLKKLKLQHVAISCIQRNIRKLMGVSDWPWWRLYTKVKPMLDVHRTETELRNTQLQLEQIKTKLEKTEKERFDYKEAVERFEAKLSDVMNDLQEESSGSLHMAEVIEKEKSEKLRLEKELKETQVKLLAVQQQQKVTEMELMDANMMLATVSSNLDDDDNDDDDDDERQEKLKRALRDADLVKRRLQQEHSEDMELLEAAKKHLERKLAESIAINDEQSQMISATKRKCDRLNHDMADLRLHLDQQISQNFELEKKQRKFDSEVQKVSDALKTERTQRDKVQRERDELVSQKYVVDKELKETKLELEILTEKIEILTKELNDHSVLDKGDSEVLKLKKQKNDLEQKMNEQEEELDEQAGRIQQLDQAKLRLEMQQERMRQQHVKELEEKDQDLEDARNSMQKKLKALELDLDEEHLEKQKLLQEKRELERRIQNLAQQPAKNTEVEQSLRLALKRTKALLRDAQLKFNQQKEAPCNKSVIKQLRNQLDDTEYAAATAVKAKKTAEVEIEDLRQQLEDVMKAKQELDQRCRHLLHENTKIQTKFEENEEDMTDLMKKYKAAVQHNSVEQITFQDHLNQLEKMTNQNHVLKEEINTLQNRLERFQFSYVDKEVVVRLEAKINDLEARLDLEQTTRQRAEMQVAHLKEQVEKNTEEKQNFSIDKSRFGDANKRLERKVRELEADLNEVKRKEAEAIQRNMDAERKLEGLETDFERSQMDLQLALRRIDDLHAVIEDDLEDSDIDDDDDDDDLDSFGEEANGVESDDDDDDDDY